MSEAFQLKIFLGFLQNSELKMYLSQSHDWSRAKDLSENQLIEVCWHEKDYIGLFLESPSQWDFIKKKELEVKSELQLYCPKFKVDSHVLCLFPQVFIK
jgi:hypothetical protein